jgi:hypothetical protein
LEVCRCGEEGDLGYVWCGEGDEKSGHELEYEFGRWELGDVQEDSRGEGEDEADNHVTFTVVMPTGRSVVSRLVVLLHDGCTGGLGKEGGLERYVEMEVKIKLRGWE